MTAMRDFSSQMILLGAYGRKYESKKTAIADWEAGKDFKIMGGPYCSIRDIELMVDESSGVYIQTKQGYVQVG